MHKLKVYATKSLFIYRGRDQAQTKSLCYNEAYSFTGGGIRRKLKVYATKMLIYLQAAQNTVQTKSLCYNFGSTHV